MNMNPVNYEEAGIDPPQEDAWSTDPYFSAICAVVNAAEKVHEGTMKNGHPYELFAVRSPQEGGKRAKDYTTFSRAHVEYIRHLLARTDGRVLLYMRVHNTFKPWTGDDGVERYSKNMRLLHLDGWATVGTVEPFENVITEPQAHAKDAEKYDMFGNPPLTAIIYAPPGTDGPVTLSPEELQNQMNARPTGATEPAGTATEAAPGGPGPSWDWKAELETLGTQPGAYNALYEKLKAWTAERTEKDRVFSLIIQKGAGNLVSFNPVDGTFIPLNPF